MGQSYLLSVPETSHATMVMAAARVDQAMCRIRDAGKTKARDRIAVLTALNLAFEAQSAAERLRESGTSPSSASNGSVRGFVAVSHAQAEQILQNLDAALGKDGQPL